jgi:hypothetical protein
VSPKRSLIENAPGGRLTWRCGNGTNSLTLGSLKTTASEVWLVNLKFGNGKNTVTLAHTGNPQFLLGTLIDGSGSDTFTQDSGWILTPLFYMNFW